MKHNFYYHGNHHQVARKIKDDLNSKSNDFLQPEIADSPRAIGDFLQSVVAENFDEFLGKWYRKYSREFSRKAMADMAFTDIEGIYSAIDVKTHNLNTRFNMPNLISVNRLAEFYESDANVFSLIMIQYAVEDGRLEVSEVLFSPIEFLDWDCLTVGALGWGQIQIANANRIDVIERQSRKEWMLRLCEVMMEFYPREIEKTRKRLRRFEHARKAWEAKEDVWQES